MKREKPGKVFVISAPSGAGKTSIVYAVLARIQQVFPIERVITYTTRTPRPQERCSGSDYHFVTDAVFQQKIEQGFFLEWSRAYGHYYGSPKNVLDKAAQGVSQIAVLDRQGARSVAAATDQAVLIWVYTKSCAVLRERLMARGADPLKQIERRLALAKQEMTQERQEKLFDYKVLNDCIEKAVCEVECIIKKVLDGSGEDSFEKSCKKSLPDSDS